MLELFASLLWSLQNLLMMHPNLGQPWKNETKAEQRTVFENHRKSLIQHCERSELCLHFEGTKVNCKCQKIVHFCQFLKIWSLLSNSVTRQITFNRTKIVFICQKKSWKNSGNFVYNQATQCNTPFILTNFSSKKIKIQICLRYLKN